MNDDQRGGSKPGAPGAAPVNPGDQARPGTPGTGEVPCRECHGTGRIDGKSCRNCGGSGRVVAGIGGA